MKYTNCCSDDEVDRYEIVRLTKTVESKSIASL